MGSTNPQAATAVHNVFVYGSLLADEVVRVLLNRVPQSSFATLHDYHRFSIKGRVYPAILPVENKKVTGKVLLGITPPELYILDTFEDVEYERKTVDVYLMDSSEKLHVDTYIWTNKSDPNLYGEWDFEKWLGWLLGREVMFSKKVQEWRRLHKDEFLKMSAGFMEELELPESKPRVATYAEFFQQKDK